MNKKKLIKARKEIDKIDNNIFKLIKKRTIIVKKVLKLKDFKNQIVDKKRINAILKNIKIKSTKNNIDFRITKRIWVNMIWSFIDYEKRNFRKK